MQRGVTDSAYKHRNGYRFCYVCLKRRGKPVAGSSARAISIKGLYAKMAKLSYIRQINRGNELLLLKESKVRLKVILSG